MKTALVIQARMGSTRLPGKVMLPLTPDRTVLDWVVARVRLNKTVAQIILATTMRAADDVLALDGEREGLDIWRGPETDVLARYVGAAEHYELDAVVRLTSDCPLIEPRLIESVIEKGWASGADYVTTEGYPRGSGDAEYVTARALRAADAAAGEALYYREHVTTYLLDHPNEFRLCMERAPAALQRSYRLTVDEMADLELVRRVCAHFTPRVDFALPEILDFLDAHPEIARLNAHVKQKQT